MELKSENTSVFSSISHIYHHFLYHRCQGKCSYELRAVDPNVLILEAGSRQVKYTSMNHSSSLHIPLVRIMFHSGCFFPSTVTFSLTGCFPDHNYLQYKSWAKHYISLKASWTALRSFFYAHKTQNFEWIFCLVLGEH